MGGGLRTSHRSYARSGNLQCELKQNKQQKTLDGLQRRVLNYELRLYFKPACKP